MRLSDTRLGGLVRSRPFVDTESRHLSADEMLNQLLKATFDLYIDFEEQFSGLLQGWIQAFGPQLNILFSEIYVKFFKESISNQKHLENLGLAAPVIKIVSESFGQSRRDDDDDKRCQSLFTQFPDGCQKYILTAMGSEVFGKGAQLRNLSSEAMRKKGRSME